MRGAQCGASLEEAYAASYTFWYLTFILFQPLFLRKHKTVGAQAPLGFYDPFNVVADDTAENFGKWREIELKHGRYVFVCACICNS